MTPGHTGLSRLDQRRQIDLDTMARNLHLTRDQIEQLAAPLLSAGLASIHDRTASCTPEGHAAIDRLVAARRARLEARLGGWADEEDARLTAKLDELARDLFRDPERRRHLFGSEPEPSSASR